MNTLETLREAKAFLKEYWKDGVACPCCGQHVQLYNYKLFATSAHALIVLSKLGDEYHHISKYAEAGEGRIRAPHFAELRFWGMIEKKPNNDSTKKASGFWRITDKGREFVAGEIEVPSRILIFNNKFQGYAENSENINIRQALDNRFDYADLMGARQETLL